MPRDLNDLVISLYREGEDEEVLRVFEKVFKAGRTLDEWRWLYRQNPEGLQAYLSRFEDGTVVSEFCALPRRALLLGKPVIFGEVVDSYTDPDYRRGLKRKGPFAAAGEWFAQTFGRYDRDVIMYGLPTPANFRIGQRFLGYTHVEEVDMLVRDLAAAPSQDVSDECRPTRVERFSADVDDFWRRVRSHHEAIIVRDTTYLNWRYADKPGHEYELWEYRDHREKVFAISVVAPRWSGGEEAAIADLLIEPDHWANADIAHHIESRARAQNSSTVHCLLNPRSDAWAGLARLGWETKRSHFVFTARTFQPKRLTLPWLRERWYITFGDFDVI